MSAYRCMPRLREARTSISPRKGGRRPERGDVGRDRGILTYQKSDYGKNPLYMHVHAVECVQMRCECV